MQAARKCHCWSNPPRANNALEVTVAAKRRPFGRHCWPSVAFAQACARNGARSVARQRQHTSPGRRAACPARSSSRSLAPFRVFASHFTSCGGFHKPAAAAARERKLQTTCARRGVANELTRWLPRPSLACVFPAAGH